MVRHQKVSKFCENYWELDFILPIMNWKVCYLEEKQKKIELMKDELGRIVIEQANFTHYSLRKVLEMQTKTTEDRGKKQIKAI